VSGNAPRIMLPRPLLIWAALAAALIVPIAVAATSPLLAWREPIYIAAGLAGVIALALLLLQPLLAGGLLPGLSMRRGRGLHAWVGAGVVAAVIVHVAALWVTSPPDVIDALLFRSPTPFAPWGVVAMVAVFATALLATLRARLRLKLWRLCHIGLAVVIVVGSVVHTLLIDGTMGQVSKLMLCALVLGAAAKLIIDQRALLSLPGLAGRLRRAPTAARAPRAPPPRA
jgi:hypothetical protein